MINPQPIYDGFSPVKSDTCAWDPKDKQLSKFYMPHCGAHELYVVVNVKSTQFVHFIFIIITFLVWQAFKSLAACVASEIDWVYDAVVELTVDQVAFEECTFEEAIIKWGGSKLKLWF